MLGRLTAQELNEMEAEFHLSPWGEQRTDLLHGILCMILARVMGGSKTAKPIDFIPRWEEKKEAERSREERMEEAKRIAIKMTAMLGGTIK